MTDTTKKTISEVLIGMAAYFVNTLILDRENNKLIFTKDKLRGEGGLLVGTVAGVLMLFSMKHTIYKAMHMQKGHSAFLAFSSVGRMLAAVAVLGAIGYFGWLNLITTFAGFFGLKVATYAQPLTHRLIEKATKKKQGG